LLQKRIYIHTKKYNDIYIMAKYNANEGGGQWSANNLDPASQLQFAPYANATNQHNPAPGIPSNVGAVTGCVGSVNSPTAVAHTGVYQINPGGPQLIQSGGYGYGIAKNAAALGQGVPYSARHAPITRFTDTTVNGRDSNMNASKQYSYLLPTAENPKHLTGGGRAGRAVSIPSGTTFYKTNLQAPDISDFAGTYPPVVGQLSHGNCTQLTTGGRKRKTRRKFYKGKKSRTHRGRKDFETNKTSKRYSEKRFQKLFNRKTMRSPDFPYVGGYVHSKKRQASKTRKGKLDFVTHKSNRYFNRRGHRQSTARGKKSRRRPYYKGGRGTSDNVNTGWHQYLGNTPYSAGYSSGAPPPVSPMDSALANPAPYQRYVNCPKNAFTFNP